MATDLIKKMKKNKALLDLMATDNDLTESYLNTNVMSLNLVFSGKLKGGIPIGKITVMAAESKQGKTLVGYNVMLAAYKAGMSCIVIDAERSFNRDFCERLGIPFDDILVYQTNNITEISEIISNINAGLERKERRNIFFMIDSWGPLVTNTLITKAEKGSDTADMGKTAQAKNGLANLMLSYDNTYFVVAHVMDNLNPFSGDAFGIPGGKRLIYNANAIGLNTSAAKYKDNDGNVLGKVVTITVNKGRGAKEFNKTKYLIRHDGGLDPFFGLLDDAIECGVVYKPKNGVYARVEYDVDKETGECNRTWKESELYCSEFWVPLYRNEKFIEKMSEKFSFLNTNLIAAQTDVIKEIENINDDEKN